MKTTVLSRLFRALGIGSTLAVYLQAQSFSVQPHPHEWVIEAVGTARAVPDVSHIMMKMEYDAGLARDAAARGEKQLGEFLAAVDALKLPGLSYRVSNNLFTQPNQGMTLGFTYVRNIVFTLPGRPSPERDGITARLEDLGARYNSHCVTCIGSG